MSKSRVGRLISIFVGCLLAALEASAAPAAIIKQVVADGCGKDLVVLGELPSHGEAKAFEVKAKIVKRLVEDCDFQALLFESSFHEFEAIRALAVDKTADASAMSNAIGGFWTTKELEEWRLWLWGQAKGGRLRLGGIDDQPSATTLLTRDLLPALISSASPEREASMCKATVSRHLNWSYSPEIPFDADEAERLAACVETANAKIDAKRKAAAEDAMVAAFHRYVSRQLQRPDAVTRDESMLKAFEWHGDQLPKGSRIIVWTSNGHAARAAGGRQYNPLGQYLAKVYRDRMLAIGFTAATGMTSRAGAPPKPLEAAPQNSLEALALKGSAEFIYLRAATLANMDNKISRIYEDFSVHAWSQHIDGVVVVRTEAAPTFPSRR